MAEHFATEAMDDASSARALPLPRGGAHKAMNMSRQGWAQFKAGRLLLWSWNFVYLDTLLDGKPTKYILAVTNFLRGLC